MDQKTREAIEFDRVLHHIAECASSSLGHAHVLALSPAFDADEVHERLGRVAEIIALLETNRQLPLGGIENIGELLERASLEGSSLPAEDWPRIRRHLMLASNLIHFAGKNSETCPRICGFCNRLVSDADLVRQIESIFDENGLVRDSASPELARMRASLRRFESALKATINRLLDRLRGRSILQEDFSTLRNGRHVFPVRAGSRGRLGGIVHGTSASGVTLYIEPLEVIEASNELELERVREAAEVQRILRNLTAQLRPHLPALQENLQVIALIDGTNALARNAFQRAWKIPVIGARGALKLFAAHHPLLHLSRPESSIPVTLTLDADDKAIVISGPNAGGKTTLMKTLALTSTLIQCGSPIPASPDSRFPLFAGFYADIGDTQDIGEGLSTFSGHMRRLREILDSADKHSLVLLDELGTGTDPEEGGALAQVLLEQFTQVSSLVIATSHLGPVKKWAEDTPQARNASFSLDPHTHRPTYRLRLDLPGPSEAFYIAENEGLPRPLLDRARELVGEQKLMMGELLRRIEERDRLLAETLREAQARAEALDQQEKLAKRRAEELRDEKRKLRESVLSERENITREARENIEKLIAELPSEEQLRQRREALNAARTEIAASQRRISDEKRGLRDAEFSDVQIGNLRVGQKVFVRAFNKSGEIIRLSPESQKAVVQLGTIVVEVALEGLSHQEPERQEYSNTNKEEKKEIARKGKKKKKSRRMKAAIKEMLSTPEPSSPARPEQTYTGGIRYSRPSVPMELDLHGYRVEEALTTLDKYLDNALLADYPHVRIIHGTGEGKLYRAVHQFLRTYKPSKHFRFGTPEEGGGGVTIVEFD